jgi:hypothetical protein
VATLTHLLAIRIFRRTSSDRIFSGEWLRTHLRPPLLRNFSNASSSSSAALTTETRDRELGGAASRLSTPIEQDTFSTL